jgi:hypothetical protein
MLKETAEYTIHAPPPPDHEGEFFFKCNSFFLKFKLKISQKCLETQRDKRIFFFLFHKQSEPANCLNPKQQKLLELRKTWEPQVSCRKRKIF